MYEKIKTVIVWIVFIPFIPILFVLFLLVILIMALFFRDTLRALWEQFYDL